MSDLIERLTKRARTCEDMALDFRDIGGRNADAKADEFTAAFRDFRDAVQAIERLTCALRPFAEIAQFVDDPSMSDMDTIVIDVEEPTGCAIAKLAWQNFRAARAALSPKPDGEDAK